MKCIIVGRTSEIGLELGKRLVADGWEVEVLGRNKMTSSPWDMAILCPGQLEPIGRFFEVSERQWEEGVMVNALYPLRVLRLLWLHHNPGACVVFLGGPNMVKPSPTYSAYRAGKAMLESLLSTLAEEYQDMRFRMLHPGVVNTKIHQQTLEAGARAENYERVMKIVNGTETTVSHDEVYRRLKDLIA